MGSLRSELLLVCFVHARKVANNVEERKKKKKTPTQASVCGICIHERETLKTVSGLERENYTLKAVYFRCLFVITPNIIMTGFFDMALIVAHMCTLKREMC